MEQTPHNEFVNLAYHTNMQTEQNTNMNVKYF